jgi:hypothetical protein
VCSVCGSFLEYGEIPIDVLFIDTEYDALYRDDVILLLQEMYLDADV